jgi:dTDP-4-amino-4,6-dideoxygalactose transaminase
MGAVVIEDAAQAMGARWRGKPVGSMGDFGLFSLGPGKPLSVAGGGVICTNDKTQSQSLQQAWEALPPASASDSASSLARLLIFRLAAHPRGWWWVARTGLDHWGLHRSSWGYTCRPLSPLQARIGLALLPELDHINRVRRENGRQLVSRLQDLDFVHLPEPETAAEPIYLRLPILVDTAGRREQLHRALRKANIGAGRMYRHALPAIFPQLDLAPWDGAAQVAERLLTLPTHHYVTHKDIDRIVEIFQAGR